MTPTESLIIRTLAAVYHATKHTHPDFIAARDATAEVLGVSRLRVIQAHKRWNISFKEECRRLQREQKAREAA